MKPLWTTLERRVRTKARKAGLTIIKVPRARADNYQVIDDESLETVAGRNFTATLSDVERYLDETVRMPIRFANEPLATAVTTLIRLAVEEQKRSSQEEE